MPRRLALLLFLAPAALLLLHRAAPPSAATAPAATLALIATVPGEPQSALLFVPIGAPTLPAPATTFEHLPGAVIRAAPLPGRREVVAIADLIPARDLSFAAALYHLAPSLPPTVLCDRVVHAARPLVTPGGRIFIERGRAGRDPDEAAIRSGLLRIDDLTVEEIDLHGHARTLLAWRGYATHLAGFFGGELFVYRVGPAGADLATLHADSGRVRLLAALAPFARDFSVDERGRVLFASRDGDDWTVERIDSQGLRGGAREVLWRGASQHPAPHAWPGGTIAFTPDGDPGLALLSVGGSARVLAPAGPGVDVVQALSDDRAWAAALHYDDDGIPEVIALRTVDGRAGPLPAVPGLRLEIAGFATGRAP
ncbi:MAG: hypothetical protein EXR72_25725 [Myxococcales bacterium]|nr:hypothetical protein [Myxococcales bacterium]